MQLIDEYLQQQTWRNWQEYIKHIPITKNDHVLDLGCSTGTVANLFSTQVAQVTAIDLNPEFIDYCNARKNPNQHFLCSDFLTVNYAELQPITGIWSSFAMSYLNHPREFLRLMYETLQTNGWIALVDVACFLSGNMLATMKHRNEIKTFELEAIQTGAYDFDFGSKMKSLLAEAGFKILYIDNDVSDAELNFDGAADPAILHNWEARLNRMQGLKNKYPNIYTEIRSEIITSLQSTDHSKNNNVRFVVAQKIL